MGLLMMLGLIVMYAIGPQRAYILNFGGGANFSDSHFFIRQAMALGLALVAFFVMAKVPFSFLQKHAMHILLLGLGACLVLALAAFLGLPLAPTVNGAVRWFDLGPLGSVQPAEFLKFAVVVFVAGLLAVRYKEAKVNDRDMTLIPIAALLALLIVFVVVLQKNMSTGVILISIVMAMIFAAGLSRKVVLFIIAGGLIAGTLLIVAAPHRRDRVATFFQGDTTLTSNTDEDLQARQAQIAVGSGGMFGVGIGNSIQATGYLPESTNDSIFAIMGETFGFVGLVVILALFGALLVRILKIADHSSNMWAKLACVGIFAWLMAHVFINVASMIGLIPLTGVTLPLVSFGGTSMVFIAGALGLAFQLSRYTVNDTSVIGGADESSRSRWGLGRTRDANRGRR